MSFTVPDKRAHRGPHPQDEELFDQASHASLRSAVRDLSLLISRGYPEVASLKLVGDRFQLHKRQRMAVARSACSDQARQRRLESLVPLDSLGDRELSIDGFNLLVTVEAALSNGIVIVGRDGAFRDIASIHGTFRTVQETRPALQLIGQMLGGLSEVTWFLDRPVSNSGRLKSLLIELADTHDWPWSVELVPDPDVLLQQASTVVATADSVILDRCDHWVNLAAEVVTTRIPQARVIDLGESQSG